MNRAMLTRSAAAAAITMALGLLAFKLWAAMQTRSTAMLGSLADTALDLVASIATLAGVWIASMPADEEHRFGPGKAAALAAMVQVILIALSAAGIGFRAVSQLATGQRISAEEEGIAVPLLGKSGERREGKEGAETGSTRWTTAQ